MWNVLHDEDCAYLHGAHARYGIAENFDYKRWFIFIIIFEIFVSAGWFVGKGSYYHLFGIFINILLLIIIILLLFFYN